MRRFGREKIEYFEFQLEDSEQVYKVPLAASMPFTILNRMKEAANTEERFPVQVDMLRHYMGDVVDELTASTLSEILAAWGEESANAGASVGES